VENRIQLSDIVVICQQIIVVRFLITINDITQFCQCFTALFFCQFCGCQRRRPASHQHSLLIQLTMPLANGMGRHNICIMYFAAFIHPTVHACIGL